MKKITLKLSRAEINGLIPVVQIMYRANLFLFSEENYYHFLAFRELVKKFLDKAYSIQGNPLKRHTIRLTVFEYESFNYLLNHTESRLDRDDLTYERVLLEEMRSQLQPQVHTQIALFRSDNFSYFRLDG